MVAKIKNYKLKIETLDNGDYPKFYRTTYYDKNGKEISHEEIWTNYRVLDENKNKTNKSDFIWL